jgi:FkbM family methyltransferase
MAREIGGRPTSLILRTITSPAHPAGLLRAARVYEQPHEALRRYATGKGEYPWAVRVRTPLGTQEVVCRTWHDLITVHEIFARNDYDVLDAPATVLDGGANIGLLSLWALTRRPDSRVRCFEPVPENVAELRRNLAAFEDRYELVEAALAPESGEVKFGVESTGRYGGIGVSTGECITVRAVGIAEAIDGCLAAWDRIELLKLDVEGAEIDILRALDAERLTDVLALAVEHDGELPADLPLGEFKGRRRLDVHRLVNRG